MTKLSTVFLRDLPNQPIDLYRQQVWHWLCCIALLLGLTACGMDDSGSPDARPGMTISLQAAGSGTNAGIPTTAAQATTKHDNPDTGNLLGSLDGFWRGWVSQDTPVSYDADAGVLRIPSAAGNEDMVIGVRRYEQALAAGVTYTLSVESENPQAAALIFLQLASGEIVPAAFNTNGGLALATQDSPVSFVLDSEVLAFYLQVQNQWQPDAPATLSAGLTRGGIANDGASGGADSYGDELISLAGDWLNWDGQPDGVTHDPANERLNISAPTSRSAYSIGTRLFSVNLVEGTNYTLSLQASSDPQAAVLLFLVGADNQLIPFNNPTPWLIAYGNESVTFTAPAGVQFIAAQVQSSAGATVDSNARPSFKPGGVIDTDDNSQNDDQADGGQDAANGGADSNQDNEPGSDAPPADGSANDGSADGDGGAQSAQLRADFLQALMARRGFDCLTTSDPDFPSFQWIDTYTDQYLVSDGYFYTSTDCSGIPYSDYLPLNIRQYSLGNRLVLADGRIAWEIDFEVLLAGATGGEPADEPAGTMLYDIVNLVDDDTFYAVSAESTDSANRPLDLFDGEPSSIRRIGPFGKPDLSPGDIAGPWVRECGDAGGSTTRSVFTYAGQTSTVRVTGYTDASCTESYFSYEIDRDITYGITAPGALGDHIMPITTTVSRAEFTNLAVGSDLPALPELPDVGSTNYGGVSMIDDTLMFTDCLFFTPCAVSESSRTDIIDFYTGKRFIRLETAGN